MDKLVILFAISLICLTFLFLFFSKKKLKKEKIHLENSTFEWKGDRFRKGKGDPVLLIHGYAGNSHNWHALATDLAERGFDVWVPNLRGHGKGDQRSRQKEAYRVTFGQNEVPRANFGFNEIVSEDIPTLVEQIFKICGKKLTIVGHSLGGVASKAYLHGMGSNHSAIPPRSSEKNSFQPEKKDSFQSEKKDAFLPEKYVKALVVIGSPTRFEHFPSTLKWLTHRLPGIAELAQSLLPIPGESGSSTILNRVTSRIKQKIISQMDAHLLNRAIFQGVINPENFDPELKELEALIENGISKVHMDLIRDVTHWARSGCITSSNGKRYYFSGKIKMPVLFIAGDMDRLAPSEDVLREANQFSAWTFVRTILLKQTSHADLISGKRAANLLGPQIERFIFSPSSLEIYQEIG